MNVADGRLISRFSGHGGHCKVIALMALRVYVEALAGVKHVAFGGV